MTFETDAVFPSVTAKRRTNVIAEALREKYQKVRFLRAELDREQHALLSALEKLASRAREADLELEELKQALAEYEVTVVPELVVEAEEARWRTEQARNVQAQAQPTLVDLYPESRERKNAVSLQVRSLLETFGPLPLRDIHKLLRTKGVETPNLPRLSQILSESSMFEADRSKGWSLKE